MTEYEKFVLSVENTNFDKILSRLREPRILRLLHAACGITSEAGEFMDALKAYIIYGKKLDTENLIEEAGDLLWFTTVGLNAIGSSLGEAQAKNVAKLRKRYPDAQFSNEDAVARADKGPRGSRTGGISLS